MFINPDIYFNGLILDDSERPKNERFYLLSIFLKHLESKLGHSVISLGHSVPIIMSEFMKNSGHVFGKSVRYISIY